MDRTLPCSVRCPSLSFFRVGEDNPLWMIPISICTSEDPAHAKMQVLMDKAELTVTLKDVKPELWVKVSQYEKRDAPCRQDKRVHRCPLTPG